LAEFLGNSYSLDEVDPPFGAAKGEVASIKYIDMSSRGRSHWRWIHGGLLKQRSVKPQIGEYKTREFGRTRSMAVLASKHLPGPQIAQLHSRRTRNRLHASTQTPHPHQASRHDSMLYTSLFVWPGRITCKTQLATSGKAPPCNIAPSHNLLPPALHILHY
jgi:hypothetical protein